MISSGGGPQQWGQQQWGQQQQQQQLQRPKIPVRAIMFLIHFGFFLYTIHTSYYHYELYFERMYLDIFIQEIPQIKYFETAAAYYNTVQMSQDTFFEFYDGQYVGINPSIEDEYFLEYLSNPHNQYKYYYSYPKITHFRYYPPRLTFPSDTSVIINI